MVGLSDRDEMRAKEAERQELLQTLKEIRDYLKGITPPSAPSKPGTSKPGAVSVGFPTASDIQDAITRAMTGYGALKRANDYYVKTLAFDAASGPSGAAAAPVEVTDLENAIALAIFLNTGTFTLYINKNSDDHGIVISPLTYPQTLLIDWFDVGKVWIKNSAQPGLTATIIKFFRS